MTQILRRLSEQDYAQLYLQTEAPLRLDDVLQGHARGDAGLIAVHDSIAHQTPDMALISLSLCGLIAVRDYPICLKDGPMGPVLRELNVAAENNLMTVGRLWLDSTCHGITPDPKVDRPTIESIPDRLRILTSIFLELFEALEEQETAPLLAAGLKTMYYQAESHSDLADKFVENLTRRVKKPAARTNNAKTGAAKAGVKRAVPDQIPLPFELNRPREGAQVVAFNQFLKR